MALQAQVESAELRAKDAEDSLDKKMAELIAVRKSVVVGGTNINKGDVFPYNSRSSLVFNTTANLLEDEENGLNGSAEKSEQDTWKIPSSPGPGKPGVREGNKNGRSPGPLEVHVSDLLAGSSSSSGGRSSAGSDEDEAVAAVVGRVEEKHQLEHTEAVEMQQSEPEQEFEKAAFKEILELKILKLVNDVEQSIISSGQEEGEVVALMVPAKGDGEEGPVLERQLRCLKSYVEKTIAALGS